MATAEQIKTARIKLAESQEVFAERFGVDQTTLSRWEQGRVPMRGPARKLIEQVLEEVGAK